MSEYVLEGGPHDGRRISAEDMHIVRLPVRKPGNVLSMSRGPQLSMDVAEYVRVGNVYRWDGLIDDAYAEMDVAAEFAAIPDARREVRRQLRRSVEGLADGKELYRIVWRINYDVRTFKYRFSALVGGRRVERGLEKRVRRQSAVGSAVEGAESGGDERIRTAE